MTNRVLVSGKGTFTADIQLPALSVKIVADVGAPAVHTQNSHPHIPRCARGTEP